MPKTGEIGASAEIKYFRLPVFGVLNIQDSISQNLIMVPLKTVTFSKKKYFVVFQIFWSFSVSSDKNDLDSLKKNICKFLRDPEVSKLYC